MQMSSHWEAVEQRLVSLTYPIIRVYADQVTDQYVILSSAAFDDADEPGLAADSSFDTDLRVKAVAGTVNGVDVMLSDIRDLLWPNRQPGRLAVFGRSATVRWIRSEFIDVDTSNVITGTKRYPAFGVDTYRISSEPLN